MARGVSFPRERTLIVIRHRRARSRFDGWPEGLTRVVLAEHVGINIYAGFNEQGRMVPSEKTLAKTKASWDGADRRGGPPPTRGRQARAYTKLELFGPSRALCEHPAGVFGERSNPWVHTKGGAEMPIDMESDCMARVVARGNQQGDQIVDVVAFTGHHWGALRHNDYPRSAGELTRVSLLDRVKDYRAFTWLDLWQADTVGALRARRRRLGSRRRFDNRRRGGQCRCRWRGIDRARV